LRAKDLNDRRRVDPETQRNRDAEIARLRARNVPHRDIAEWLNMSRGAVQKAVRRHQKLADALSTEEPGNVVALIIDELSADDVADDPEQWRRLNALERYRLPHEPQALALVDAGHPLPPVHDDDHALCCIAHGIDPDWRPDERDTASWREGVDRARGETDDDADDW
jgi:hypothetical protein